MEKTATGLGYAGLIPFAALTFAALGSPDISRLLFLFMVYSAVILSFLGGIHWGILMRTGHDANNDRSARELSACMLPSLVAWLALTLPSIAAISVLAASYLLWWWYDRTVIADAWYQRMRRHLTVTVVIAHIVWIILLV